MKIDNAVALPLPVIVVLAALAMVGLQAAFEYQLLAPIARDVTRLSEEIHALRARQATARQTDASTTQRAAARDVNARLDSVVGQLQRREATAARIETVHRIADQQGVVLRKASYQVHPAPGEIGRHEIQADLAGTYPAIRQFLRELMVQDQALALESLEFGRHVGAAGVRAQVRIALYFHRPAP